MNTISSSDSIAGDRWQRALQQLANKTLLPPEIDGLNKREVLLEVLSIVRAAEQISQQKRWKWKNGKGETIIIRDIFVKMTVWIEKFKAIGDTIVQYDPGNAALPWAAARFVLTAAINDIQTNAAMLEGLELVFHIIAKFEVIENLYLRRKFVLKKQLDEAVVSLYGSILEYLLEARHYFSQGKAARVVKSVFQLEDIKTKHVSIIMARSGKVEEYVQLISGQIENETSSAVARIADSMQVITHDSKKLDALAAGLIDIYGLILQEKDVLEAALSDLNEPIKRMCSQITNIEDKLEEEERLIIFDWLSSTDYNTHHRNKIKTLLPESGQWLMKKYEFREWMESSKSSILWLHGIPGSGKSFLIANVIEYINGRNTKEVSPAPLAYFYCSRNATEPERADPVELLRTILEQLSCSDQDLPIRLPVAEAYQLRKRAARGRRPARLDLEDTVKLILDLLESNPATIVIDALDECDPAHRQELLDALQMIVKESNNVVKIFISSRDDNDLVHRLSRSSNLYVDASENTEDITKFVTFRVRDAIRKEKILCGSVPSKLRDEIITILIGKACGMFRLVSLHIESLCNPTRVKTRANVHHVLEHLPPDLHDSYTYLLDHIATSQKPNPEIARRTFKWLLSARKKLTSQSFILAVCSGMKDVGALSHLDILSVCSNLVVYDDDTDHFRFAHLSVIEYLECRDEYSSVATNAFCAEQCLSWLINRDENLVTSSIFNAPTAREKPNGRRNIKKLSGKSIMDDHLIVNAIMSFSKHVDLEWGEYARKAGEKRLEGRLKDLLERFLLFDYRVGASTTTDFALWVERVPTDQPRSRLLYFQESVHDREQSPLFVACAFDLSEIAAFVVEKAPIVLKNEVPLAHSPVIVAAECNSLATIDMLIEKCQKYTLPTNLWTSPLWSAILNLHLRIVLSILAHLGRVCFNESSLLRFLRKTFEPGINLQEDYELTLLLLLSHSNELQLTEDALIHLLHNKFPDGTSLARALIRSGKPIVITQKLVNICFFNRSCGRELIDAILAAEEGTTINKDAFIDLLRSANSNHMPIADRARMALLKRRKEYKMYIEDIKDIQTPSGRLFRRCMQLAYIATAAAAKLIDTRKGLSSIMIEQAGEEVELTWEHVLLLQGFEKPVDCLQCVLRSHPRMSQTAVNILLASWPDSVIPEMLKVRRINVTKDVIRVVAWNRKHGENIMRLLLDRESEVVLL